MTRGIENAMRLQAMRAQSQSESVSIGIVKSYDPTYYAAIVELQPGGVLTGWLPIVSPWIGNGWGLYAPPSIGDQVEVHFIDGLLDAGFVGGRFYNDQDRPASVNSGEFWLVHQSGSLLKFLADGSVSLASASGKSINITGDVNVTGKLTTSNDVTVTGKVTATGDVKSSAGNVYDVKGTMDAMRTFYNVHTHSDPQGGTSSPPLVPMT